MNGGLHIIGGRSANHEKKFILGNNGSNETQN